MSEKAQSRTSGILGQRSFAETVRFSVAVIKEFIDPVKTRAWRGEMPVTFLYTYGVAGERFFREIKERGCFTGSRCSACQVVYVPPRLYCPGCFEESSDFVELPNEGTLLSWTAVHVDAMGKRLSEPLLVGQVRLKGTRGALVHRLVGFQRAPRIGARVRARFRAERTGGMQDIEGFETLK